jgi:hypothetical protein
MGRGTPQLTMPEQGLRTCDVTDLVPLLGPLVAEHARAGASYLRQPVLSRI